MIWCWVLSRRLRSLGEAAGIALRGETSTCTPHLGTLQILKGRNLIGVRSIQLDGGQLAEGLRSAQTSLGPPLGPKTGAGPGS